MSTSPDASGLRTLAVGTKVEVRTGFDGSWSPGFEVDEVIDRSYRLRRRSDGQLLPEVLPSDAVRRERKTSMWWV